jgi:hypothetical protein
LLIIVLPSRAQEPLETTTRFDGRRAELRWVNNRWLVCVGQQTLKDFGSHDEDARTAWHLIRELGLNAHGVVGSPLPVIEYWLVDGKAPQGDATGLQAIHFDNASLKVEKILGHWCLRDAHVVLFNFGQRESDAQKALSILQRHGFNRVAFLGRPSPLMMVFFVGVERVTQHVVAQAPAAAPTPEPSKDAKPKKVDGAAKNEDLSPLTALGVRQLTAPAPFSTTPGTSLLFDWRQAQLTQVGGHWRLQAGGALLADFGSNERAAREALRVVQAYRFTERCSLGEQAQFTWFLCNGRAPQGVIFGVRCQPFRTAGLSVRHIDKGWAVCDVDHVLWCFGDRESDARQAVDVLRKAHFDHVCQAGDGPAALTFCVCGR